MLINDHHAFKAMATLMRNELTSTFKVGDVLTVMKISDGVQPVGEAPHKQRRAA